MLGHSVTSQLFATPWTIVSQAPLSMRLSQQEFWNQLLFPSPGIFLTQRSNLCLLHCHVNSLPQPPGKPPSTWKMFLNGYLLIPVQFLLILASVFKSHLTSPDVMTFRLPQNPIILSSSHSTSSYRQDLINPNTLLLTVPSHLFWRTKEIWKMNLWREYSFLSSNSVVKTSMPLTSWSWWLSPSPNT